jgi:hypothetical protein
VHLLNDVTSTNKLSASEHLRHSGPIVVSFDSITDAIVMQYINVVQFEIPCTLDCLHSAFREATPFRTRRALYEHEDAAVVLALLDSGFDTLHPGIITVLHVITKPKLVAEGVGSLQLLHNVTSAKKLTVGI